MINFGSTLKSLRLQNSYTQAQLAAKLNVTKSVISAYENDLRMPSYEVLIRIANVFKVSTDFLLGVDTHNMTDFSGLTEEEQTALKQLILAMKRRQL